MPGYPDTRMPGIIVDDPEAVHDLAVAAGAEIVWPLENPEYGGSG